MARTKILSIGGGSVFASGGVTNNVVPKSNGVGALVDSSITDNGTTVISTEPFQAPAGTSAANGFQLGAVNTGLYAAGGLVTFAQGGTNEFQINGAAAQVASNGVFQFSNNSGNATGSGQTFIRSRAAANTTFGAADLNGTPVAQTISVQNAITGSNLPAANTTVDLGLGTGTGLVGTFVVRGGDSSVATGTTAQTNIVRCVLNATKALTTGAATTLVSIPLASLAMCGGYICVYMEATDGTAQATRAEEIYYAGENSAGVFVVSSGVVGTGVTACTAAKTLTATYALTGANPALLQVTPTLTGITATRFTCIYEVHHMGNTQPTV